MAKKKEARFEEEGTGLGKSAPEVSPTDFDASADSDAPLTSEEIDLSPATSSIAVVASTEAVVVAEPAATEVEATKSRYSRRDSLRGEVFDEPEPAAMLTADRLLEDSAKFHPAPESGWRKLAYYLTLKH